MLNKISESESESESFNLMVVITAALLASTLVNGLQHNQIHVIETYF